MGGGGCTHFMHDRVASPQCDGTTRVTCFGFFFRPPVRQTPCNNTYVSTVSAWTKVRRTVTCSAFKLRFTLKAESCIPELVCEADPGTMSIHVNVFFSTFRMTIDPRIPTMQREGRSTSSFHQQGRHCLHQARSAVRFSVSHVKDELHPSKNRS